MWPFSSTSPTVPQTGHGEEQDLQSLVAEKRVVGKVDLLLMPLLTISFGLQYYDKVRLYISLSPTHQVREREGGRKVGIVRGFLNLSQG